MEPNPLISVAIATYNSERTLALSLESLRNQNYPADRIEILVLDGGSSDQTLEIAKKFGCTILDNPRIQQDYAKHMALLHAKGKYLIYLDSDEVIGNPDSFKKRVHAFQTSEAHAVLFSGYEKPKGSSSINDYLNIMSDPFNYFMYQHNAEDGYLHKSLKRRYGIVQEDEIYALFHFPVKVPFPLIDMCAGATIDLDYLKKSGSDLENEMLVPRLFLETTKSNRLVAVLKEDPIIHHSLDSLAKFIEKIKWRIVANIHYQHIPGTGYANREDFQPKGFTIKKYLFLPYAFSLILPLWTSVVKSVAHKKPVLLLHLPLTLFTAGYILFQYGLKVMGYRPDLKSYGNKKTSLNISG